MFQTEAEWTEDRLQQEVTDLDAHSGGSLRGQGGHGSVWVIWCEGTGGEEGSCDDKQFSEGPGPQAEFAGFESQLLHRSLAASLNSEPQLSSLLIGSLRIK